MIYKSDDMDTYSGPMCELSTVAKAKFRDAMFDGIQRFINRADDHTWLANIFGPSFEDVEIAISSENITSENIPIKPSEMVIFVRIVERFRGRPSVFDKSERSARMIFFPVLFAMDGSTAFPMTCRIWIDSQAPQWSGHPSTLTQCNTPFALKRVSDELITAILMACNNRPKSNFEIIEEEATPPYNPSSDIVQNFGSNAQSSLNVPTGSNDDDVYVDKA